ncbi:hypothetical protein AYI69_g348 [Smittium culicis]|uniref:Halomucin n=1 Tax=Smittium culicis TaxID=133412 RepID=A0A1R1YTJ9_9FUNG|nr:hypothetical protein AYI69_g348 [Smittium culicis]
MIVGIISLLLSVQVISSSLDKSSQYEYYDDNLMPTSGCTSQSSYNKRSSRGVSILQLDKLQGSVGKTKKVLKTRATMYSKGKRSEPSPAELIASDSEKMVEYRRKTAQNKKNLSRNKKRNDRLRLKYRRKFNGDESGSVDEAETDPENGTDAVSGADPENGAEDITAAENGTGLNDEIETGRESVSESSTDVDLENSSEAVTEADTGDGTEAVADTENGTKDEADANPESRNEPIEEYANRFDRFSSKKNEETGRLLSSKEACDKSLKNKDGKHDPNCDYYSESTGKYMNLRLSNLKSGGKNSTSDNIEVDDSDVKENSPSQIDSEDQLGSGEDDGNSLSDKESTGEIIDEAGEKESNDGFSEAPETPDNHETKPEDESDSTERTQMIPVSGQEEGKENAPEHPEIDESQSIFDEIDPEFGQTPIQDLENSDSINQDNEGHEDSSKESSDTSSEELIDSAAAILKKRRMQYTKKSQSNESSDISEDKSDGSLTEDVSPEAYNIKDSSSKGDSSPGESIGFNSDTDGESDKNDHGTSDKSEISDDSNQHEKHNHIPHDSIPESFDGITGEPSLEDAAEDNFDTHIDTMELFGCEGVECIPVLFKKIESIEKNLEKNSDRK